MLKKVFIKLISFLNRLIDEDLIKTTVNEIIKKNIV